VRIWAEHDERWVRLFFQDNAIGIATEHHEQIFSIFQRLSSKYEGTGIGLAIVKKAVERMGGKVSLVSAVGKGSTFRLELQRADMEH
jgi:signal transduction histidine kinase